ncbi:cysteine sulfinic acid decarboxylase-like isoform X2 [Acanthaster planci]|uniref:Cysteine sulfinic acid decarboxylase-like isoform X2 n=1 Tax=Acanthaster planci TaxID=133434 RepID=A0A8B7XQN4_ACAPL|nr:cysteine sulfinic acid decarboxylase-like isoform X2 [Acanthaster planci]
MEQSQTKGLKNGLPEMNEREFFQEMCNLIVKEAIDKTTSGKCKVLNFVHPHLLSEKIDLAIRDDPASQEELLKLCQQTFDYSVRPGHPRFFNQLFGGQDLVGLAGQWMTDAINPSIYTFEVSPVFTLMELEVLCKLRQLCGYKSGDGIFCPGGSIANMYALNIARYKRCPEIKQKGLYNSPRLVAFTSEQSHYSLKKGMAFLGLGVDNLVSVKCDQMGRMIPEELEKEILEAKNKGGDPYFVCATSGTTVLGAYDPLVPIADICERHGLWLHIDAAWGGGALASSKYSHLMQGVERSNSLTWCQHKMMGVPLQCSAFLLREENGLMHHSHCAAASYLFQKDKFYDMSYDTGDKSIQCSRKADALKLWLMWKAKGNRGFDEEITRKFDNSRYMADLIRNRENFKLLLEPQCTNVTFWYIPPSLKAMPDGPEFQRKLHKVAPIIKERMMKNGTMMIGYQPLGDHPNFIRMVYCNHATTTQDVEWIVEEIERLGHDIVIPDEI